ncbi:MAG: TetR/AcrR family transcriptional regulator [Chloroflexi bacterium]|nr:TetR/AcrR family transcriptional regulator [Chloroflexota bacterium]
MKKAKVDRRVQRTRHLLDDALMELILEKGYEAVTVQDILDRANLGRSTFYAHYRDKDELLFSGFERLRESLEARRTLTAPKKGVASAEVFDPSLAFFRHAGEQHRLYKAMVGKKSGEMVLQHLHKYLRGVIREHLLANVVDEKRLAVPLDILVEFGVSSFLALLVWWLEHKMPYSPDEMDAMFKRLTMPGFEAAMSEATSARR